MEMKKVNSLQNTVEKVKQIVEGKIPYGIDVRMMIYTEIYGRIYHVSSQELRSEYEKALKHHLRSTFLPALRKKEDEFLLTEVVKQWEYYKHMVSILSRMLTLISNGEYTERWDLNPNELAQRCFHEIVNNEVLSIMLVQINKMREGETIHDGTVLKNVASMILDFGMVQYEDLEPAIFEDASAYYFKKAASWVCEYSCQDYLLNVVKYLRLEKETTAMHCLHQSSQNRYLAMVQNVLLGKYECQLLKEESDCHPLLRNGKMDDLSEMFKLFCGLDKGIQLLAKIFRVHHVTRHGISFVKHQGQMVAEAIKESNEKEVIASEKDQFVRSVLQLYEEFLRCVEENFMNHYHFKNAVLAGFQSLCSEKVAGNSIWELLVTYCDNILTNRNIKYPEVIDALDNVAEIFPCLCDKDLVADFYRKKLADRLLSYRSLNVDCEKHMILKLKADCGRQFTYKMEGMLSDWTLSMKPQSDYDEYLRQNPLRPYAGIEFSVTVLTSGFWPSYKSPDSLVLPVEMARHLESFKEFYNRGNMNRKLTWNYSLGTCIIIGRFDRGEIQIHGTPCHAGALLLFNETERLSFSQVKSQLNLEVEDAVELLKSLACSKYKILRKIPDAPSVVSTDCYEFNARFFCNERMIRLQVPTDTVKEDVEKNVFQARRHIIDASIVRTMKSRNVLSHKELVMQCIELVKDWFKPDMKEIKRRIENLIDREFLERDKENRDMYNYLP